MGLSAFHLDTKAESLKYGASLRSFWDKSELTAVA
jgi:hypothetical protein